MGILSYAMLLDEYLSIISVRVVRVAKPLAILSQNMSI